MIQDLKPINDIRSLQQATVNELQMELDKAISFLVSRHPDKAIQLLEFLKGDKN